MIEFIVFKALERIGKRALKHRQKKQVFFKKKRKTEIHSYFLNHRNIYLQIHPHQALL